jgi:predicted  nucleic acid-binding Zn-ribbon protein
MAKSIAEAQADYRAARRAYVAAKQEEKAADKAQFDARVKVQDAKFGLERAQVELDAAFDEQPDDQLTLPVLVVGEAHGL